MGADPPLVGRETEIEQLDVALSRAAAGGGGAFLLIAGEAGAGKTALLEHGLAQAQQANIRSAWATVPDAEGAPPFWTWTTILRELGTGDPNDRLTIAAETLSTPDPSGGSPDQERFRIFDQVARALRSIEEPMFVAIDDLHRADGGTLRLLEFLAPTLRRSRLVLVLGARPTVAGTDLAATFGTLIHAGATRIDLRPWSTREIAIVVERWGGAATRTEVDQLQQMTGGNPFFVLEVARSAPRSDGQIDLTHVPPTVIDVLGAEARRLDPARTDILRLAAAWGQGAPLALIARAAGCTPHAAVQNLPANFLTLDRDGALWFRHDLIRDAVYQGMPDYERAGLHARLADAVDESSSTPEARARQIAVHGCRAGAEWKPDLAFAAARAAAREAASMYAVESAAAYLVLANDVRRWCVPDPSRDLEFLVAYGDALTRAGQRDQARPVLDEAIILARRAGDFDALARIALVIGLGTETAGVPDRDAWQLLDEALAKLPPDEHQLRARLLARAAWQALAASDGARLKTAAEAAVTEARASGDPGTIAQALNAYFISPAEQELHVRQQTAREITSHAALANDIDLMFSGLLWEAHMGMETGDIPAARVAVRRYQETAERWPMPYHAWYRWVLEAALAFLDDRLDDAAAAIEQVDPVMTPQREFASLLHATQQMELAARRGDRDGFETAAERVLACIEHSPIYPSVRAHIDACLGRRDSALQALDQFIAMLDEGPRDNDWLSELAEAALAAIRLDARPQAGRLLEQLTPYRDHWSVLANATVPRGPIVGILAGLARLLGDVAGASAYEAEARAAIRRAGTPGALIWMDGGPHWTTAEISKERRAGLSNRELEVLGLVAAGCSNQEIADRLVLSIRTVQRHIENIYAKTGARGRAAVSVFAATHGLVAADS